MGTLNLYQEFDAICALQHCCLCMRAWGRPEYELLNHEDRRAFEKLIADRQLADYVDTCQKELMIAWPQLPNIWLDSLINAMTVERGEALTDEQFKQLGLRIDEMFRAGRRFEVVGDLRTKQAGDTQTKSGPEAPNYLWWQGVRHDLTISEGTKAWKLLVYLWGKPSASVADIAAAVWKNKRTRYATMKPTVTRMNGAICEENLPHSWSKKRGAPTLIYTGQGFTALVSE